MAKSDHRESTGRMRRAHGYYGSYNSAASFSQFQTSLERKDISVCVQGDMILIIASRVVGWQAASSIQRSMKPQV